MSVGIDEYETLDTDNHDNGVYVIKDWNIVDRLYFKGEEQKKYSLIEMLKIINNSQPKEMQERWLKNISNKVEI